MATCSGRPGSETECAKIGGVVTDEAVAEFWTRSEDDVTVGLVSEPRAPDLAGATSEKTVIGDRSILENNKELDFAGYGASVKEKLDERPATKSKPKTTGPTCLGKDDGCSCEVCLKGVPRFDPVVEFSDNTCEPIGLGESWMRAHAGANARYREETVPRRGAVPELCRKDLSVDGMVLIDPWQTDREAHFEHEIPPTATASQRGRYPKCGVFGDKRTWKTRRFPPWFAHLWLMEQRVRSVARLDERVRRASQCGGASGPPSTGWTAATPAEGGTNKIKTSADAAKNEKREFSDAVGSDQFGKETEGTPSTPNGAVPRPKTREGNPQMKRLTSVKGGVVGSPISAVKIARSVSRNRCAGAGQKKLTKKSWTSEPLPWPGTTQGGVDLTKNGKVTTNLEGFGGRKFDKEAMMEKALGQIDRQREVVARKDDCMKQLETFFDPSPTIPGMGTAIEATPALAAVCRPVAGGRTEQAAEIVTARSNLFGSVDLMDEPHMPRIDDRGSAKSESIETGLGWRMAEPSPNQQKRKAGAIRPLHPIVNPTFEPIILLGVGDERGDRGTVESLLDTGARLEREIAGCNVMPTVVCERLMKASPSSFEYLGRGATRAGVNLIDGSQTLGYDPVFYNVEFWLTGTGGARIAERVTVAVVDGIVDDYDFVIGLDSYRRLQWGHGDYDRREKYVMAGNGSSDVITQETGNRVNGTGSGFSGLYDRDGQVRTISGCVV
jgi:hypothetical protein